MRNVSVTQLISTYKYEMELLVTTAAAELCLSPIPLKQVVIRRSIADLFTLIASVSDPQATTRAPALARQFR
jgi:hypothetical protein